MLYHTGPLKYTQLDAVFFVGRIVKIQVQNYKKEVQLKLKLH